MSISAMTNVAFARRTDVPPIGDAPKTEPEIVAATGGTLGTQGATSQMQVIATYIPSEVLTLYVATVAALNPSGGGPAAADAAGHASNPLAAKMSTVSWILFYVFVVLTPAIVWLVYAAKVRASNRPLPLAPNRWPVWEMFAATVAYVAWAFALPHSPFQDAFPDYYNSAVAGIVVLVVSTMLGLLAPIVNRPLPT